VIAAEYILQRIVERMAHMQIAGDIGRRDHDAKRFGAGALQPPGAKGALGLPLRRNAPLDGGRVECFFHHVQA